jgi:hemoglobin
MAANKIPSLFEWAGGMQAFETLFDRFYDKVLADELAGAGI